MERSEHKFAGRITPKPIPKNIEDIFGMIRRGVTSVEKGAVPFNENFPNLRSQGGGFLVLRG